MKDINSFHFRSEHNDVRHVRSCCHPEKFTARVNYEHCTKTLDFEIDFRILPTGKRFCLKFIRKLAQIQ